MTPEDRATQEATGQTTGEWVSSGLGATFLFGMGFGWERVERLLAEAIPSNDDGDWPAVIAARWAVAGLLAEGEESREP